MKIAAPPTTDSNEVAGVVHQNVHSLLKLRRQHESQKRFQDRVSDRITSFVGSMPMVYANVAAITAWICVNTGLVKGIQPFDPYPFALLALVSSLEAIFLATFVLISQNRASVLNEKRADLDIQINLLSEHEITRLIHMVDAISVKLGTNGERPANIDELKKDIAPETVLEAIAKAEKSG